MVGPPRREAVRPAPLAACGWWRPRADGTSLVVVGTGAHKRTLQASPALACREAIFGLTRARLWGHRVCGLELPVPGQPRRARQPDGSASIEAGVACAAPEARVCANLAFSLHARRSCAYSDPRRRSGRTSPSPSGPGSADLPAVAPLQKESGPRHTRCLCKWSTLSTDRCTTSVYT